MKRLSSKTCAIIAIIITIAATILREITASLSLSSSNLAMVLIQAYLLLDFLAAPFYFVEAILSIKRAKKEDPAINTALAVLIFGNIFNFILQFCAIIDVNNLADYIFYPAIFVLEIVSIIKIIEKSNGKATKKSLVASRIPAMVGMILTFTSFMLRIVAFFTIEFSTHKYFVLYNASIVLDNMLVIPLYITDMIICVMRAFQKIDKTINIISASSLLLFVCYKVMVLFGIIKLNVMTWNFFSVFILVVEVISLVFTFKYRFRYDNKETQEKFGSRLDDFMKNNGY